MVLEITNHFYCYRLLVFQVNGPKHGSKSPLADEFLNPIVAQDRSPQTLLVSLQVGLDIYAFD